MVQFENLLWNLYLSSDYFQLLKKHKNCMWGSSYFTNCYSQMAGFLKYRLQQGLPQSAECGSQLPQGLALRTSKKDLTSRGGIKTSVFSVKKFNGGIDCKSDWTERWKRREGGEERGERETDRNRKGREDRRGETL